MCFCPAWEHYKHIFSAVYGALMKARAVRIMWSHLPLSELQVRRVVDDSGGTAVHALSF